MKNIHNMHRNSYVFNQTEIKNYIEYLYACANYPIPSLQVKDSALPNMNIQDFINKFNNQQYIDKHSGDYYRIIIGEGDNEYKLFNHSFSYLKWNFQAINYEILHWHQNTELKDFWFNKYIFGFHDPIIIKPNSTIFLSAEKVGSLIEKINQLENRSITNPLPLPNYPTPIELNITFLNNQGVEECLSTNNIWKLTPSPIAIKNPESVIDNLYYHGTSNPNDMKNLIDFKLEDNVVMGDMSEMVILRKGGGKNCIITLGTLCCVVVSANSQTNLGLAHIQGSSIDNVLVYKKTENDPVKNDFPNTRYKKINLNTLKHSMSDFLDTISENHKYETKITIAGGQNDRYLILKIAQVILGHGYKIESNDILFNLKEYMSYEDIPYDEPFQLNKLTRFDSGISENEGYFILTDPKLLTEHIENKKTINELRREWVDSNSTSILTKCDDIISNYDPIIRRKYCDQFEIIRIKNFTPEAISTTEYYPDYMINTLGDKIDYPSE